MKAKFAGNANLLNFANFLEAQFKQALTH
jgi:hypothetical protein